LLVDEISINRLKQGFPGLSPVVGAAHAEACIVCLENQKHISGVEIAVQGLISKTFQITWDDIIDEQVKRAWNDLTIATEWAACGIAMLVIEQLTGLVVVRQSIKGNGFDYWLGEVNSKTKLVQERARLEVSGILKVGRKSQIRTRLKQKIKQIQVSDKLLSYAVVVEFSEPVVWMEQK
jgi:hypothetical protein